MAGDDNERVEVADRAAWRAWLETNHRRPGSIWLVYPRKPASGEADRQWLAYPDIVDEALCFGWIDSLPRKLDERRSMLRISPRNPRSAWSAVNRAKAARLIEAGLMTPAGQAVIDAARASGRWDALAETDSLSLPPDLAHALDEQGQARAHFERFPPSVRRGILEWIVSAKRAATRAARIAQTAELAARNERANQWRGA